MPWLCWCTTDSTEIRSKIIDGYTKSPLGLVKYMPVQDSCSVEILAGVHEEISKEKTCTLFPNPAIDFVTISCDKEVKSLQLVDATGKYSNCAEYRDGKITLSCLPPGLYLCMFETGGNRQIRKIVKTE
jgi:hypothetical protein